MKISVAAISYNHEKYIDTWLDGILSQIWDLESVGHELEVNVVFDCPTDLSISLITFGLGKICYSVGCIGLLDSIFRIGRNSSVRVVCNETNRGGPYSMTKALSLCTGELTAWVEVDDYYKPGKLLKSLDTILVDDLDGVHGDVDCILPDGTYIENAWSKTMHQNSILTLEDQAQNNHVYTCTYLIKSEFFKNAPTPLEFSKKFKHLGDYPMFAHHVSQGAKIGWMYGDAMSTYRDSVGICREKLADSIECDTLVKEWIRNGCKVEDLV